MPKDLPVILLIVAVLWGPWFVLLAYLAYTGL